MTRHRRRGTPCATFSARFCSTVWHDWIVAFTLLVALLRCHGLYIATLVAPAGKNKSWPRIVLSSMSEGAQQ